MFRLMMMKNRKLSAAVWVMIAFVMITVHLAAAAHPPECSDIAHGRSCSLDSNAETVAVFGNRVFVGAADHIYSFRLDLTLVQSVDFNPQADKFNTCTLFGQGGLSNSPSECRNFIRVIQKVPSGFETNAVDQRQIMVCGTNAFFPKCTIHQLDNLSNYSYMTPVDRRDAGYSPFSNKDPIVALLASNGRFFSATVFEPFQTQQRTIGMASGPLSGDSLFQVAAPTSDPLWFHRPEFISTYEIDDHIYFFIREPAYEVDNGESVVYSRAVRICKNDNGQFPGGDSTHFLTYQKARMRCSYSGQRGSIPYNYDNLESTFLWNGTGNQTLTLYGVFSSPDNGPEGGAICKFSFDATMEGSLTKVFEDGDYTVRVMQNNQQVWITEQPGHFSCPGTSGMQRTVEQANTYQLVASSVEAMDPEPLHVVSGKKLDKIAVDVIEFNDAVQEIVYFTTESGEIRQAVHITGSQGSSSQVDHVIQSAGGAVSYLSVHRGNGETRQVYATTEDTIMTISRGKCTQYQSCFECLDSRDAYCGWVPGMNKCMNKLELTAQSTSGLIEAHSVSEKTIESTCGTRPTDQIPTPVVPTVSCPLPPRPNGDPAATNAVCPPETVGLSNGEKTDMDIPTIVGATVGAFVLGVPVGAFVCFIFFRMFVKPRQQSKSSGGLEESYDGSRQTPYNLHPNGSGPTSMNSTTVGEQGGESSTNTLPKKDLSISVDVVTNSSVLQPPGPPRYVDVHPRSGSVPSGINGSAIPPSGGSSAAKRSNTVSETGMGGKRSTTADELMPMSKMREKDDSAFGGSEKDILPPLMGSEELETYHKKHMKQSKHHNTGPVNGVSRVQIPGFKVPKGRTPSTTWLRENSVSDASSDLSSPLQSPISDV